MKFFTTEIKMNPEFVASSRILITARRYVGSDMRWYAELNSGFHDRTRLIVSKVIENQLNNSLVNG